MARDKLIQVKLSPAEKAEVQRRAYALGIWPSQLVRVVALYGKFSDEEIKAAITADRKAGNDSRLCVASA